MKNILLIAALIVGLAAQAQTPVLEFGERLPNLYYWDSNWFDYKVMNHWTDNCTLWMGYFGTPGDNNANTGWCMAASFNGRACLATEPLKVIGIAALTRRGVGGTTMHETMAEEYFRLYQMERDSMYFKGEVRFDTIQPQYIMKILRDTNLYPTLSKFVEFNLYLAYLDTPVVVYDTFVVGGTTFGNLFHGYDSIEFPNDWQQYVLAYEYQPVFYMTFMRMGEQLPLYPQNPAFGMVRHYATTDMLDNSGGFMFDTTKFYKYPFNGQEIWLPFFAIYDTNFVYEACVGVASTGLQVEGMDTTGVTLSWDDSGVEQWQVSVAPEGVEADNGMLFNTAINYMQVSGLERGRWYSASVRTLCDSVLYGFWSSPVLFYLPVRFDTCDAPTWLHVTALDSAMATLAWDSSDAQAWEVEMGLTELGMMGGQTTTLLTNSIQKSGLYCDAWYWARVRAQCDTDFWSEWTDTIHFYVPMHHPEEILNPIEQSTYLMPNPAQEEVTVASSFRVKVVELYGADGKLLQHKEVNAVGTTLDLKGLPAGLYFVRVVTTAGMTTKRLVVE